MSIPQPGDFINGPAGPNTIQLEDMLGNGAFGFVFKGVEVASANSYAVKFPQTNIPGINSAELLAINNEITASATIKHQNVVTVLYSETSPIPYLVMEFMPGGTLQDRLDAYEAVSQLPEPEILYKWVAGLVDGIAAINELMLHRDIKPDNVLMVGDEPKIGDFGLSKIVGAATRPETFKGGQHILYMAPEGWRLETNNIQIDMYAMGITLYQAASLQYPYKLPSFNAPQSAIEDMHLYEQPIPLEKVRPDLPIAFSHLVMRLMAKRPDDRFADWQEAKDALHKGWSIPNSNSKPDDLMSKVVAATGEAHERYSKLQSEQAQQQAQLEQKKKLDEYQIDTAIQQIRNLIEEYNVGNSLGKITVEQEQPKFFRLMLPFDPQKRIKVEFFEIEPPLNLKSGSVRVGALVAGQHSVGFNLLLLRKNDEDIYGGWKVCHVRNFMGGGARPRPEPFGLNKNEMNHIYVADQANHIYKIKFSDDFRRAFLELIQQSLMNN